MSVFARRKATKSVNLDHQADYELPASSTSLDITTVIRTLAGTQWQNNRLKGQVRYRLFLGRTLIWQGLLEEGAEV
jgi:hypothetical protein